LRRVLTSEEVRAGLARRGPVQAARFTWAATARGLMAVFRQAMA
jgi:hypothetical protein